MPLKILDSPFLRAILQENLSMEGVMDRQPVKSTNVKSVGYDAEKNVLEVEFKSGGVYQYADVPPIMYSNLLAAPSIGAYVAKVVRAARKGVRMDDPKKE
jgi:hypothetical protein